YTTTLNTQKAQRLKSLGNKSFSDEIRLSAQNGTVYVADCHANQIFQIDQNGRTTVLAGTGERGHSGDGASATSAQLNCPTSVSRSIKGDFFIADSGNLRIRRIDRHGMITTVAGNGTINPGEDGSVATDVGIGRPMDIMVDDLLVVYFTTTNSEVMMLDPRGKLRRFSANDEGYVPHDFEGVSSLQLSLQKRVMTMDVGRRQ